MQKPKIVIASQHYPPDQSTTAAIMSAIAHRLAEDAPVVVLSGMQGATHEAGGPGRPVVVEIKNRLPDKAALARRAVAEILFALRVFFKLLARLQRGDLALTVTAPFMLPHAVAAAARLKRARSVLIMHDLFPDVLVTAGILRHASIAARLMRAANGLMFRALAAVVVIGRDSEERLLRYPGVTPEKIWFIPNWATLDPAVRPIATDSPFRSHRAKFVVGLSGNLGFTHDPDLVFEAARLLRDNPDIHFLLSGWGIGFERLQALQSEARLENVTLVDRVSDDDLETLLCAGNVWLIPYRANAGGISAPSRFYNLLAVGRPVIIVAEKDTEAALTVIEHDVGWVVPSGDAAELADTIRLAASSNDPHRAERAIAVARRHDLAGAMTRYAEMAQALLRKG